MPLASLAAKACLAAAVSLPPPYPGKAPTPPGRSPLPKGANLEHFTLKPTRDRLDQVIGARVQAETQCAFDRNPTWPPFIEMLRRDEAGLRESLRRQEARGVSDVVPLILIDNKTARRYR